MHPISHSLLTWYTEFGRTLPWRGETDPYLIWISEVMLQQTRVDTVIPYYKKWKKQFPNVHSLASASEEDVLLMWEGLGYYTRARNLHLTARKIVADYQGLFPQDPQDLCKLPGIGQYTANAIASICYSIPVIAFDANIKRVLARLLDLAVPITSSDAVIHLHELGDRLVKDVDAGDLNQALMDLGSMICLPKSPRCDVCPLQSLCLAFASGTQEERPVKKAKKEIPLYQVVAAVIKGSDGKLLIAKRPAVGMLPGLWEYPGGKVEDGETDQVALSREIREELDAGIEVGGMIGVYKHAYSHYKVNVRAYWCVLLDEPPKPIEAQELQWVACGNLREYAMGKVDRMISEDICSTD